MSAGIRTYRSPAGRFASAILLIAAPAAVAGIVLATPARADGWSGTCDVRFRGTSNLHDFTGNVPCEPFRLDVVPAAGGRSVIQGAEVAVRPAGMNTGNGTRDRQMREMLEADRFPGIRATFGEIDPVAVRQELRKGPQAKVPLDFTLTIRDVARRVHAVAANFRESGAGVSLDVDYAISLKEFKLKPPRAMFGLLRVGDDVRVTTSVRLDNSGPR